MSRKFEKGNYVSLSGLTESEILKLHNVLTSQGWTVYDNVSVALRQADDYIGVDFEGDIIVEDKGEFYNNEGVGVVAKQLTYQEAIGTKSINQELDELIDLVLQFDKTRKNRDMFKMFELARELRGEE